MSPTKDVSGVSYYITTAISLAHARTARAELANVSTECVSVVSKDYPEDPMTPAAEELISKIRSAIVMPVLFATGAVGTLLSLVAFYRQNLRNRINLCLFSLELVNLINVAFLFLLNSDHLYLPFDRSDDSGAVAMFVTNRRLLGMLGFMYGAMYLSAVVSCERCFTVLFPLHSKALISTRVILTVMILGTCATVLPFFLVTWSYHIVCFRDIAKNKELYEPIPGEFYFQNMEVINATDGIYYGIILSLGIPVVVVISTAITGWKLKQSIAFRKQTTSSDTRKDTGITRMLVSLSLEFLVLSLPNIVIRIIPLFEPEMRFGGRYNNSFSVLVNLSETGSILNSSVDFFVYYHAGTKFRETVQDMLPWLRRTGKHERTRGKTRCSGD